MICAWVCVLILRLSVYTAQRNVGQFPFEEKKKGDVGISSSGPESGQQEREREEADSELIVSTEDKEGDGIEDTHSKVKTSVSIFSKDDCSVRSTDWNSINFKRIVI